MRKLIFIGVAAGLLASSAQAADKEDLRDARCIAAMAAMADKKVLKKNDEWILTATMLYSLGRLEVRNPNFDLDALFDEALADEDETSLIARGATCMQNIDKALEVLTEVEPQGSGG